MYHNHCHTTIHCYIYIVLLLNCYCKLKVPPPSSYRKHVPVEEKTYFIWAYSLCNVLSTRKTETPQVTGSLLEVCSSQHIFCSLLVLNFTFEQEPNFNLQLVVVYVQYVVLAQRKMKTKKMTQKRKNIHGWFHPELADVHMSELL